jgi:antitoxin VapB
MLSQHEPVEAPVNEIKKSELFKSGNGQAVRVPEGFELPGTEVIVTKDGDRLIIEPKKQSLREFLDALEPLDIEWPDVDEGLLPPDDIKL